VRVLVTGASGQLGRELVEAFTIAGHEVVAADRSSLDVAARDQVRSVVSDIGPDALVNAAAWTAVDDCEGDPDRAWRDNALAVRWLAEACDAVGAHLTQVSTDYVFDGTKAAPYVEWDTPSPANVYGRSKLAGEREAGERALVVRTSWVVGRYGNNMVKTILRLASGSDRLRFVDDQIGHPTVAADLAGAMVRLVEERQRGVWHVTNQGAASWYEVAREVLRCAGDDPARVDAVPSTEVVRPAARPANSVLDNAALRLAGYDLLPDFRDSFGPLVASLLAR
jgi:dTDP-4-dehydrorhamnose reductase